MCDPAGHHAQVCGSHSGSLDRGHKDVLAVWQDLGLAAGLRSPVCPSGMPQLVCAAAETRADIKTALRLTARQLLLPLVLLLWSETLPSLICSGVWAHLIGGNVGPSLVQYCVSAKNRVFSSYNRQQGVVSTLLVGTTRGGQGVDAVVLLFLLAHEAS